MKDIYHRLRQQKLKKQTQNIKRPALQYYGGKWRLAPWVIQHFPDHRVYVEPFGGAASVLLRKPRSQHEVYNDLNQDLVNFFRVVRNPATARKLVAALKVTPFSRTEFDRAYQTRSNPIENARRLVVRSFMGFNGSGASSGKRSGFRWQVSKNRQSAALSWMNYPQSLSKIVERLRHVVIEQRPAEEVIQAYDKADTLFYVDPPYLWETRAKNAKYNGYQYEMSNNAHEQLLNQLRNTKASVVLSGYDNPMYNEMLLGWHKYSCQTRTTGGRARTEVIWVKFSSKQPD